MDAGTRDKLRGVSTATLASALYKRGLRNQMVQGVVPLSPPKGGSMVGPAYTLRYIPAREDLNSMSVFRNHEHPQRKAVEACPAGAVFVIDSRKDARAASAGGILATRLMVRGCAGMVTDGGFRDSAEIGALEMPSFHARPSGADQSDDPPGDRHQRADRLRRRAGVPGRHRGRRHGRGHHHPVRDRRRDRRRCGGDDGVRGFRHRAGAGAGRRRSGCIRRRTRATSSGSPLGGRRVGGKANRVWSNEARRRRARAVSACRFRPAFGGGRPRSCA